VPRRPVSSIHWPLASRVAGRMAGRHPLEDTYHQVLFARQAPELVARAAELVVAETGLPWEGHPEVAVVSRREWAQANIKAFGKLLGPAEAKLAARGGGLGRRLASRLVGAELGALVGVLARRVLGQYELVVPRADGESGDVVMFVGANVMVLERAQQLRPSEFRFWVALHECTHRLQFTGVPWLRDHFFQLVSRLIEASVPEPGRMRRVAGELRKAARQGRPVMDEAGIMGLLATPEQRQLIDEVQALMSLLEGHGHVVMDRIGARELVSQHRMSRILKTRRKDPRMSAFLRVSGLEMKMKQYELGERFIEVVERHAGFRAIDRAWEEPEHLPTLEEIKKPQLWLERVG
jgi:coenzyme F420 biosynthesis associated uncharacterized protein